ncbi:unnamed protein product [Tetraodon nigroviridis]|uniref:(spotted green pufferfish) hypothetical protein n=1 Tax=Tetraodon nigroviridis TaxID=99883 RepID=Q4T8K5_TETNG|nr:unnamed protein product [Tetraodon nigroviridis]
MVPAKLETAAPKSLPATSNQTEDVEERHPSITGETPRKQHFLCTEMVNNYELTPSSLDWRSPPVRHAAVS